MRTVLFDTCPDHHISSTTGWSTSTIRTEIGQAALSRSGPRLNLHFDSPTWSGARSSTTLLRLITSPDEPGHGHVASLPITEHDCSKRFSMCLYHCRLGASCGPTEVVPFYKTLRRWRVTGKTAVSKNNWSRLWNGVPPETMKMQQQVLPLRCTQGQDDNVFVVSWPYFQGRSLHSARLWRTPVGMTGLGGTKELADRPRPEGYMTWVRRGSSRPGR